MKDEGAREAVTRVFEIQLKNYTSNLLLNDFYSSQCAKNINSKDEFYDV